jgi:hypothetical protein
VREAERSLTHNLSEVNGNGNGNDDDRRRYIYIHMAARRPIRVCEGVAVLTSTNTSNHTCATESGLRREPENSENRFGQEKKKKNTDEKRERGRGMADLSKFAVNNVKICFDFCFFIRNNFKC